LESRRRIGHFHCSRCPGNLRSECDHPAQLLSWIPRNSRSRFHYLRRSASDHLIWRGGSDDQGQEDHHLRHYRFVIIALSYTNRHLRDFGPQLNSLSKSPSSDFHALEIRRRTFFVITRHPAPRCADRPVPPLRQAFPPLLSRRSHRGAPG